jgi:hypothetical protein
MSDSGFKITGVVIDKKVTWDQVFKALNGIKEITSEVGVRSDAGNYVDKRGNVTPVLKAAAINEFGGETFIDGVKVEVPERSFLRQTVKKYSRKYVNFLQRSAVSFASVIEQQGASDFLKEAVSRLGDQFVNDIHKRISAMDFQPNALITQRKKKGVTPLFATGKLRRSIKSKLIVR